MVISTGRASIEKAIEEIGHDDVIEYVCSFLGLSVLERLRTKHGFSAIKHWMEEMEVEEGIRGPVQQREISIPIRAKRKRKGVNVEQQLADSRDEMKRLEEIQFPAAGIELIANKKEKSAAKASQGRAKRPREADDTDARRCKAPCRDVGTIQQLPIEQLDGYPHTPTTSMQTLQAATLQTRSIPPTEQRFNPGTSYINAMLAPRVGLTEQDILVTVAPIAKRKGIARASQSGTKRPREVDDSELADGCKRKAPRLDVSNASPLPTALLSGHLHTPITPMQPLKTLELPSQYGAFTEEHVYSYPGTPYSNESLVAPVRPEPLITPPLSPLHSPNGLVDPAWGSPIPEGLIAPTASDVQAEAINPDYAAHSLAFLSNLEQNPIFSEIINPPPNPTGGQNTTTAMPSALPPSGYAQSGGYLNAPVPPAIEDLPPSPRGDIFEFQVQDYVQDDFDVNPWLNGLLGGHEGLLDSQTELPGLDLEALASAHRFHG